MLCKLEGGEGSYLTDPEGYAAYTDVYKRNELSRIVEIKFNRLTETDARHLYYLHWSQLTNLKRMHFYSCFLPMYLFPEEVSFQNLEEVVYEDSILSNDCTIQLLNAAPKLRAFSRDERAMEADNWNAELERRIKTINQQRPSNPSEFEVKGRRLRHDARRGALKEKSETTPIYENMPNRLRKEVVETPKIVPKEDFIHLTHKLLKEKNNKHLGYQIRAIDNEGEERRFTREKWARVLPADRQKLVSLTVEDATARLEELDLSGLTGIQTLTFIGSDVKGPLQKGIKFPSLRSVKIENSNVDARGLFGLSRSYQRDACQLILNEVFASEPQEEILALVQKINQKYNERLDEESTIESELIERSLFKPTIRESILRSQSPELRVGAEMDARSIDKIRSDIQAAVSEHIKHPTTSSYAIDHHDGDNELRLSYSLDKKKKIPILTACSDSVTVHKSWRRMVDPEDKKVSLEQKALLVLGSLGIPPCPPDIKIEGNPDSRFVQEIRKQFDKLNQASDEEDFDVTVARVS